LSCCEKKNKNFATLLPFVHQNILNSIKENILKYPTVALIFVIIVIAFFFFSLNGQGNNDDEVSIEQVRQMISEKDSLVLVDVRRVAEFDGPLGHIPGAILIPLAELESRIDELEEYRETEMIVICRSGNRSGPATRLLRERGFKSYNMLGGMLAWNTMLETTKIESNGLMDETNYK
jgi:rhodanese-related sulfurtransferase